MTTRLVTSADGEALSQIAASVFRDTYESAFETNDQIENFIATNLPPAALKSEIEAEQVWYTLGYVDDTPAGFIKLERTLPPECVGCRPGIELAKLYVLKPFHGGGIANVLMQRCVEYAEQCGVSQMWLCVWEKNPRARAFYQRWGFDQVGEISIPWSGVVFHDLVMNRPIETAASSTPSVRRKIDFPFANDDEVTTLIQRFEACTWPYDRWNHRAHLAVGLSYARSFPFDEALHRLRQHINLYNATCGEPAGYNETVTILFMRKIVESFCLPGDNRSLSEVVEDLVRCCSVAWLYKYYSRERIWSDDAKQTWIEPDLKPLDF